VLGQPPAQIVHCSLLDFAALGREPFARVLLEGDLGSGRLGRSRIDPLPGCDLELFVAELAQRARPVDPLAAVAERDMATVAHGDRDVCPERDAAVAETVFFELCLSWSCHL
jgi:hypothetical protein